METKNVNGSIKHLPGVAQRCAAAKALANVGDYEGAREALGELWGGIGDRPKIDGLALEDQAEVLLRAGSLSGWLAISNQAPGALSFAKDLISESIRAYETLDDQEKIAEAQSDLALCYWREGAMDEARVWFREALSKATAPVNILWILARSTSVEISSHRFGEALALLDQAVPLLNQVNDNAAQGFYHLQRSVILQHLEGVNNLELALTESAAASVKFEQAKHQRYFARAENNSGQILRRLGRFDEALAHLERAQRTFNEFGDDDNAAQVNDSRARVFIEQERYVEAEKIAFSAASALEAGDDRSLLAVALETQGVALARLGRYQSALGSLKRAAHIAESAADQQLAGKIFLTILEEVKSFLSPSEIGSMYHEADSRLGENLDAESMVRLRASARLAIANTATARAETSTRGSFEQEVHNRESELIKAALDESSGSVTRAARILGLTHQGLCYIINHRHKHLLGSRAPIRVRRKSIIKKR
jgi:tetratricopeptide (TPR) repeat protein